MNSKEWFKTAQFGMMVHFGLYSLLAGEYRGKRIPTIGEWIQAYYKIPNDEYHKLAQIFNPIYFDAEEWVQIAKSAGMQYMVVTAKHHEGFALFKSHASRFNVVDATPFKRDMIGELAQACRKYGMKLGLYYSQDIDWSHPHGGGYNAPHLMQGETYWDNRHDFPDIAAKDYSICFHEKILPQVEELLTQYGEIFLMWFDTPYSISLEQSNMLYQLVKKLQPNCLVNSRIGNGMGDYESAEDNEIPDDIKNGLFESPITLNDTWGFKYFDDNWKDADQVLKIKNHLKKRGSNCLLNVGPDHLGRIPVPAIDILKAVGEKTGW